MASLKVRQGWDRTVYLVNIVLACITVIPLFLIIGKIVLEGYQQINWDFFTKTAPTAVEAMMAKRANTIEGSRTILPGGIANGIVGTLIMTLVASIIAIPIGLLGGIYLSENRSTRLANVVRFVTDLLQGTPSIVIGIIAYAWVVVPSVSLTHLRAHPCPDHPVSRLRLGQKYRMPTSASHIQDQRPTRQP